MKRQDRAMAWSCGVVVEGVGGGERRMSGGGRMMCKGPSRQSRAGSPAGGSWVSVKHPASKLCSHLFSGSQRGELGGGEAISASGGSYLFGSGGAARALRPHAAECGETHRRGPSKK